MPASLKKLLDDRQEERNHNLQNATAEIHEALAPFVEPHEIVTDFITALDALGSNELLNNPRIIQETHFVFGIQMDKRRFTQIAGQAHALEKNIGVPKNFMKIVFTDYIREILDQEITFDLPAFVRYDVEMLGTNDLDLDNSQTEIRIEITLVQDIDAEFRTK